MVWNAGWILHSNVRSSISSGKNDKKFSSCEKRKILWTCNDNIYSLMVQAITQISSSKDDVYSICPLMCRLCWQSTTSRLLKQMNMYNTGLPFKNTPEEWYITFCNNLWSFIVILFEPKEYSFSFQYTKIPSSYENIECYAIQFKICVNNFLIHSFKMYDSRDFTKYCVLCKSRVPFFKLLLKFSIYFEEQTILNRDSN